MPAGRVPHCGQICDWSEMFAPHFEQNIEKVASNERGMQANYRNVSEIAITSAALK